jgi:hypothetical protein
LPEVWLGLWIEGFDGMEGEREGNGGIIGGLRKFMGNSFKKGYLFFYLTIFVA